MPGLEAPLRGVVGGKTATVLERELGLHTVRDLLRYYPRRYDERGQLTDLRGLRPGEDVTVLARVSAVSRRPPPPRRAGRRRVDLLKVTVTDGTGALTLTFFNQGWRQKELAVGAVGFFAGTVRLFGSERQLTNPQYELMDAEGDAGQAEEFLGELVPVYPATGKLTTWTIRRSVRAVLDVLEEPPDPLPEEVRAAHGLPGLSQALRDVHRPPSRAAMFTARERLTWDEALTLQVALARRRLAARQAPGIARPAVADGLLTAFDAALPFVLTGGQREIGAVIEADLAGVHPMHRLLQGEVGSGKTVVALRAMLQVVDAGGQAALLAPTEVLAMQHERSLRQLLGPLGRAGELGAADPATRVALLTGSQGAAARRAALAAAADGSAGIVVGTHALIQHGVQFADLGLVVVDEQHRFGVEQREALRAKGDRPPHLLVMTATPIPRTVAMTVYGDLETSALRELPAGRSPIQSVVIPMGDKPSWLERAWARIHEETARGHQAYVVCPRIGDDATAAGPAGDEASAGLDAEEPAPEEPPADETERRPPLAVLEVAARLADGPLRGLRLAVLHGRLPPEDKDAVMRRFAAGELDVLVATTVIEVGVDVPNATVMVVLDAERFGLSQLHQLRGRVGRGSAPGLCAFVTEFDGGPAVERLEGVAATSDGFEVARLDLSTRREGDVLGAAQSGRGSALKLLSLLRHEKLITEARGIAVSLTDADPQLRGHPALAAEVAVLEGDERAAYLEKT